MILQNQSMEDDQKLVHILIIEDDEEDYIILRDSLMELGDHAKYELDWVQTYEDGMLQILHANHDVYLIDHYLGENSGVDLLNEAIQAGCQAPMIMITGRSDIGNDKAALMAGATDYLIKGQFDGIILERSIRYALERNRLLKRIHQLAVRDALTEVYNRRELHRFLNYELIKSKRYKHPFSLLMMDIDNFKEINDRFGHLTGDGILQKVATVLLNNTRGCDLLARYGGDEFTIVLPETAVFQGWQCAERLRKTIQATPFLTSYENKPAEEIRITISTGVAEYPGDVETWDMLIEAADQALYQAKHQGRNQVVRFQAKSEKG